MSPGPFTIEDARYAEVRRGLAERGTLSDHFAEHPWEPGERRIAWYVSMPYPRTAAVLAELQDRLVGATGPDVLEPLAADEFHVTVQTVGRAADLEPAGVRALRAAARAALADVAPFALLLGGANAFPDNPFVEARGWRPLVEVRERLRAAHRSTVGGEPPGAVEAVPHLSLAYVRRPAPAAALATATEDLRNAPVGRLGVRSIELVCLAREDRHYRWTVEDSIPLARTPGPAPAARGARRCPGGGKAT